jgi:hypothetical protein
MSYTLSINQACNMLHIRDERRIPRACQFVDSKVEGVFEALICDFLVIVGVIRYNANEQLIQRVFDAFSVECCHFDALFSCEPMVLTTARCGVKSVRRNR